jgi:DNA-binding beta-propeller fold protein YncE
MSSRKATLNLVIATSAITLCTVAGVSSLARTGHTLHPRTGAPIVTPGADGEGTRLHNGWRITPAGNKRIDTGDMLLGGAVSPDGKLLAIANTGFGAHALHVIELATEKEIANIPVPRAWNGLAWSPDSRRIYVGGGISNPLADVYLFDRFDNGEFGLRTMLTLFESDRQKTCIAGLAISPDGKILYVLNNSDNRLYVLEAKSGAGLARIEIGDHPVVARLANDGKTLYVANWGGSEVVAVDVTNPSAPVIGARMNTGAHPNDIAIANDGRLFVSAGNADAVTVLDSVSHEPIETIKTSLTPKAAYGSTPNAVALTPDSRTLFVANADNNDVAVIDVAERGKSHVRGFIPSAWYPTAVHVTPDGKRLIVGSGKGLGTHPNPVMTPIDKDAPMGFEYHGFQLKGVLSFVDVPNDETLAAFTKQVYANTPYKDDQLIAPEAPSRPTAIPTKVGDASPIKHVLYIIKENRTYDQVFGDIQKGNGDSKLTLFGREVTPNHHALAEEFVLLDNLYCNGEVSADGHPWSTSAYATDFTQRSWVLDYSRKGKTVATESVTRPPNGYIWEAVLKKGLLVQGYYQLHPTLMDHSTVRYVESARRRSEGGRQARRDTDLAKVFIEDFKEFEASGKMPNFFIMSLGEDHTQGTTPGAFTPKASVASNDVALGQIVEAVSHSKYWKEFAIFVIEDDAQNGPDSVDSHRTMGLVISPYTRRQHLDSTMYTTMSMLRTMELILGIPPLTQYDAAATPMFESFTNTATLTPYQALPARIDVMTRNTDNAYGAKQSARMDWSDYDRINEDELNEILWHSIKGVDSPMPSPVRRALPMHDGRMHAPMSAHADDDDQDEQNEQNEQNQKNEKR